MRMKLNKYSVMACFLFLVGIFVIIFPFITLGINILISTDFLVTIIFFILIGLVFFGYPGFLYLRFSNGRLKQKSSITFVMIIQLTGLILALFMLFLSWAECPPITNIKCESWGFWAFLILRLPIPILIYLFGLGMLFYNLKKENKTMSTVLKNK